jgi:hypothetical protein
MKTQHTSQTLALTPKIMTQQLNLKTWAGLALITLFVLLGSMQTVQAQRFSATLTANSWKKNDLGGNSNADFNNTVNASLNLRYYTRSKIAVRAGVGVENFNYTLNTVDGASTNLEAKRQDLQGIFGLEWHPTLGRRIDIYPGLYVPVTVVGDNIINDNLNSTFTREGINAGLGALVGANIRFLKIFRLGAEFDARFQNVALATQNAVGDLSLQPFKTLNYTANLTFGIQI